MPPLDSARSKVIRAGEHIKLLEQILTDYSAREPYKIRFQHDLERDVMRYWLDEIEPPPIALSVVIGDIAYQLRSALDHIVWQLALLKSSSPPRIEFPIFHSRTEVRKSRAWPVIRTHVPDIAFGVIESFQPYHRTHGPKDDLLWILHETCIIDKHRFFNPVSTWVWFPNIEGRVRGMASSPLDPGQIFAEVPMDLNPEVNFNPQIQIHIRLSVGGPSGSAGVDVMKHIHQRVADEVIPAFERFFP